MQSQEFHSLIVVSNNGKENRFLKGEPAQAPVRTSTLFTLIEEGYEIALKKYRHARAFFPPW